MSKVRALLVPVAVAWLFVHVSVVTATTALMVTTGSAGSDIICTCADGADHGVCPMHHKPADSARCRMQGTQSELSGALLSMLGPLALPVATVNTVTVSSAPLSEGYEATLPLDWTAPPDGPPPRR